MDKRKTRKEVIIREGGKKTIEDVDISHEEYYSTREQLKEVRERDKKEEDAQVKKINPILKIAIIVLITVISMLLYFNQDKLSFDNIVFWLKTQVVGTGVGDGYPVEIIGSSVSLANFTSENGNSVMLSDTALTVYSPTGKELLTAGHDFNYPALKTSGDYFLMYGIDQTAYSVLTLNNVLVSDTATNKVLTCDIASNGTHIIASQSTDFASEFNLYSVNGTLKYTYKFASGYISAVALNSDASQAIVSVVYSQSGVMSSDIYVFDFTAEEPEYIYTSFDNVVLYLNYNSDVDICAVGDNQTTTIINGVMSNYSYSNKSLSAVSTETGRSVISLTNATGESLIAVFDSQSEVVEFQIDSEIDYISSYGQSIAILSEDNVECYNLLGEVIGICEASYDTVAIALSSESDVYMMGLSKVEYDTLYAP